jgi:hypothetical protein
MFIYVTNKRVRSKSFRVFCRNVFVQMRILLTGMTTLKMQSNWLLVKKYTNSLVVFDIRGERTRNIYRQVLKRVFREVQSRKTYVKQNFCAGNYRSVSEFRYCCFTKFFASSVYFVPLLK